MDCLFCKIVAGEIPARKLYEDDQCQVFAFPLIHRIPTQGYIFVEKTLENKLDPEKIKLHQLPVDQIKQIKKGLPIQLLDTTYEFSYFCLPKKVAKKYVYASDTSPLSTFHSLMEDADLLYHEATYLHELENVALERGHSTTIHAANFAKIIRTKKLIIGHFSSRYKDLKLLEEEARTVFPNSHAGIEGQNYLI